MPINRDKLRGLIAEDQARAARQADVAAPAGGSASMARALQISGETGAPPLAVADDLSGHEEELRRQRMAKAAASNPALAAWLARPEHAALARDDLDALDAASSSVSVYGPVHQVSAVPEDGPRLSSLLEGRSIRQFASDFGVRFGQASRSTQAGALQAVPAAINLLNAKVANPIYDAANKALELAGVSQRIPRARMLDPFRDLRERTSALNAQDEARLSTQQKVLGEETAEQGFLASIAERGRNPGLLVTDAGMLIGSVANAFGPLSRGTATTQIGLSATAQAGATEGQVRDNLEAKGVGEQDAGAAAAEAFAATLGIGLVAPRVVPGGDAFERWAAGQVGTRAGSRLAPLLPLVGEPLSEAGEEGGVQLVTNAYSGDPLTRGVGQAAALGLMGGGLLGIPAAASEAAARAAQAASERDWVDRAVAGALASQTRAQAPAQFEALVAQANPDAKVYVPAEALAALYQGEDNARAAIADLTGDDQAWVEAGVTGEVGIPLAKYVTHLAEQHAALAEHVRLQPGASLDPTPELPDRESILADIQRGLAEMREAEARENGPAGEVYDAIYGQLFGHVEDTAAAHYAAVIQSVYRSLAERLSTASGREVTAADVWRRFRINVGGDPSQPVRGQARDVDLALDPVIEAALAGKELSDQEVYGDSLLTAIVKGGGINPESVGGGDLAAMDAGRLRPGLLSLAGGTVEAVAESLANDPTWVDVFTTKDAEGRPDYRELLELVRRELGGEPVRGRASDAAGQKREAERERFRADTRAVAAAFAQHETRTGQKVADLTRAEQRAIAQAGLAPEPNAEAFMQDALEDPSLAPVFQALAAHDEAFQYPVSNADTLRGVLADVAPRQAIQVLHEGPSRVRLNGPAEEPVMAWQVLLQVGEDPASTAVVTLELEAPGRMYLDVSKLQPGVGGGAALYAALFNFAHNTGRVFVGDPNGLSDAALLRRTEAMAAAALKFGGTWFMAPHPRQVAPDVAWAAPLAWNDADQPGNLESLLRASYDNVRRFAPEIEGISYDVASAGFVRAGGEPVSDDELGRIADRARAAFDEVEVVESDAGGFGLGADARGGAAFGGSTIARAILAGAVLRGTRQARADLVAAFDDLAGRHAALAGRLYQTAYHGTHYRGIERFSLQAIGSGEGAQVYGWGLYFASSRAIAEWYRESVSAKRLGSVLVLTDPTSGQEVRQSDPELLAVYLTTFGEPDPPADAEDVPADFDEERLDAAIAVATFIDSEGYLPSLAWVDRVAAHKSNAQRETWGRNLRAIVTGLQAAGARVERGQEPVYAFTDEDGTARELEPADFTNYLIDQFEGGATPSRTVRDVVHSAVARMRKGEPVDAAWVSRAIPAYAEEAAQVAAFLARIGARFRAPGALYAVDVPEAHELLDWDARMEDQPPAVLDALADGGYVLELEVPQAEIDRLAQELLDMEAEDLFGEADSDAAVDWKNQQNWNMYQDRAEETLRDERMPAGATTIPRGTTGGGFYKQLMDEAGFRPGLFDDHGQYQQAASEALQALGIKGLRYLDNRHRNPDFTDRMLLSALEQAGGDVEAAADIAMRGFHGPDKAKQRAHYVTDLQRLLTRHNFVIWDEAAISEPQHLYQSADALGAPFRAWFGESKVTDESGQPAVVYHGTAAAFDVFAEGSWFAADPRLAHGFIGGGRRSNSKARAGSQLYPVYLSLQNPLEVGPVQQSTTLRALLTQAGATEEDLHGRVFAAMEAVARPERERMLQSLRDGLKRAKLAEPSTPWREVPGTTRIASGASIPTTFDQVLDEPWPLWRLLDGREVHAALQALGYDGIKATESTTYNPTLAEGRRFNRRLGESVTSTTWQVFRPAQVKSAVGNQGGFDPANDSVLFQSAVEESPAFQRWFGDSQVTHRDGSPREVYHGTAYDFTVFEGYELAGWFSEEPSLTERHGESAATAEQGDRRAQRTVPVYLSVQRPVVIDGVDMNDDLDDELLETILVDAGIEDVGGILDLLARHRGAPLWEAINSQDFQRLAEASGFDGVRVEEDGVVTWGVFHPQQIKSSLANSGAFDPGNPDMLFQSERPFFSRLRQVVEESKQAKAPGAQWLGMLVNTPGVKGEELDYYNLPEWLAGQKSVTREALAEYLRAHELEVSESLLGKAPGEFKPEDLDRLPFQAVADGEGWNVLNVERDERMFRGPYTRLDGNGRERLATRDEVEAAAYDFAVGYARAQGGRLPEVDPRTVVARIDQRDVDDFGLTESALGSWGIFDKADADGAKGEFLAVLGAPTYARAVYEAARDMAEMADGGAGLDPVLPGRDAPFASLTLPGGDNYRVLLLKLPVRAPAPVPEDTTGWRVEFPHPATAKVYDASGILLRTLALSAQGASAEEAIALAAQLRAEERAGQEQAAGAFTDGHFPEPNVVAHVRFDERTEADGTRVLFVQELQSDWHQKGRKRGYRRPMTPERQAEIDAKRKRSFDLLVEANEIAIGPYSAEGFARREAILREREALAEELGSMLGDIPDAPFKTSWPELVMKRMVRYAAEHGFDKVAFPTEALVPRIEGWGLSAEQIRNDPRHAQQFGAILDRYAVEVPRIGKKLAKTIGARWATASLPGTVRGGSAPAPTLEPYAQEALEDDGFENAQDFPDGASPLQGRAEVLVNGRRVNALVMVDGAGVHLAWLNAAGAPDGAWAPWAHWQRQEIALEDDASAAAARFFASSWATSSTVWNRLMEQGVEASLVEAAQVPALVLTEQARATVLGGLPLFQPGEGGGGTATPAPRPRKPGGPRGSIVGREGASIIRQRPDAEGVREFNIALLAGADLSTFLHEAGHAFLEILADLATDPDAPEALQADWQRTLDWLGVKDRAAIGRAQHEQWARGFEAYLREGRAPSSALRRAFSAMKVWLSNLYRSLLQLDVTLTDEVRGVFDRLLATDAEIAAARERQYHEALIADALAVQMTEEQHEAYQRAVHAAREEAEAVLAAEVLSAQLRAEQAWWRAEKRKLHAQVLADTRALPVYRARRWLREGKLPDGTPSPQALKLDKQALLDLVGPEFLKRLRGLYAREGGVSPEAAASVLGYGSGRELVEALVAAPPLAEVVAADVERLMAERHPDPLLDGSLPERALQAVHNDKQAQAMLLEVQALERHTGGRVATQAAVIAEVARQLIEGKRARDVQPQLYRAGEAKAGREAFAAAAAGDWPAALAARRRQLLNLRLYQEAVRVRAEVEAAQKYLRGFTKAKRRAKLGKAGADYLEQIDGLLERFDFKPLSNAAADRRARLADWISRKRAEGVDVDLPPELVDEAFRVPARELTVAQLRALRAAVKHLAHLADLKNTLLLKGQRRDREAIDAEVAASVRAHSAALPDTPGEPSAAERWTALAGWLRATLAGATDMARRLDGYGDLGPVWSHTVGVIRDAMNNAVNPALRQAQEDVATLYTTHFSKAELRALDQAAPVAGVPGQWSRGRILALALNWGNEGNRAAILTQARGRLTPEEVGLLLGTLSGRDWDFVQAVWDHIDGFWPAIAESQRRRKGLVPEKVPASSFQVVTAEGTPRSVRGGYYPLKYDHTSQRGMREEADEFYEAIRTGRFAKAATRDGHTLERVGSGGRVVRLDLDVIEGHLRDVIRDLHLGDAVNYVHQVLHGAEFGRAVTETGQAELVKGMDLWLRDVATGELGLRNVGERFARAVRTNFTASVLTWKAVSAALQVTGIVQTSVVLGKPATLEGVARFARRPREMVRYVYGASPFMAARLHSHVEAVQTVLAARAGRWAAGKDALLRHGYFLIGQVQRIVDMATWLGAEAKAMAEHGDVEKARAYADDVVARAQGSGEFFDKTALQRGTFGDNVRQSEWVRAATTLQGYLITKHNAMIERTAKARRGIDGVNARSVWEGLKWSGDMANLFVIEAIIVAAIRGGLPDDEDEDGWLDDWAAFLATETFGSLAGSLPGLGSLVTELRGYDSRGIVAGMWHEVGAVIEQYKQGELDAAMVKAHVRVAGYAFGIPSSQINKTIDAIAARMDGEDVALLDYLRGPPKD